MNSEGSGFFNSMFEGLRHPPNKKSIKIVLVGDGSTGKTSYFTRLSSGDTEDYKFNKTYDATRGCNICQIEYAIGVYKVTVHLFDTAGQEKFGALRDSYLMGADGVVLMYDLEKSHTKSNVFQKWIPEIKRIMSESPTGCLVPVAVIGNKNDRIDVNKLKNSYPNRSELQMLTDNDVLTNTVGIRTSTLKGCYDSRVFGPIEHFYMSVKADDGLLAPINWLLTNILKYFIPVDAKKTTKEAKTVWSNTTN